MLFDLNRYHVLSSLSLFDRLCTFLNDCLFAFTLQVFSLLKDQAVAFVATKVLEDLKLKFGHYLLTMRNNGSGNSSGGGSVNSGGAYNKCNNKTNNNNNTNTYSQQPNSNNGNSNNSTMILL